MTELDAEQLLASLLENDGWRVRRQVGLGQKHVDIIAARDETWAIEVKLDRWRRAASQAFLNSPYVHRSYVAMPRNPGRRVDLDLVATLGIGLIEFDHKGFTLLVTPPCRGFAHLAVDLANE